MKLQELCGDPVGRFRRVAAVMRLRRRIDASVVRHVAEQSEQLAASSVTRLREGAVWSVGPHEQPVSLHVVSGDLWITDSGSDLIRVGGDTFHGGRDGKVVIQALSDSVIEIALVSTE